jgi:hypothetical protein
MGRAGLHPCMALFFGVATVSKTNAELLSACEDAIYKLLSGAQSISMNGRTLTMANLDSLYRIRDSLKTDSGLDSTNGGFTVAEFS